MPSNPYFRGKLKHPMFGDLNLKGKPKAQRGVGCAACNDTGKNSKGEQCHPCLVKGRVKATEYTKPEPVQGELFS